MKYLFKLTRRLASARTSAALVGLLAGFSACSKDAGQATAPVVPPPPNQDTRVATVVISPATVSGSLGESGQFTATARNAAGIAIPGQAFSWSVSDPTLAKVNSSGFVTTLGVGPVTVSASVGAITGGSSVTVAGEPVSAVVLSPSEAVGSIGQVAQFNATLMGGAGNVLSGRPVLWSSDNPSVVTVDSTGMATQRSMGTATISAVSASFRGTARLTVGPRQIPKPGSVADLNVLATSDTSATLSFTQVSDGMGMPANYSIRFSPGAITWSTAAVVPRGSCAPSLAGTVSGGTITCSVLGLLPLKSYSFELVAYRGTPSLDAVYGEQSNVATAMTTATPVGPIVPVADVKVSPPAATASLGIPIQLNATAHDARGAVLVDRPIVWTSSNTAVVTLSTTGLATSHSVGTASISATSSGHTAVSAFTVTPATAAPASVSISPAVITMTKGATQTFTSTVLDAAGGVLTGQAVSWSSNNRAIATVSAGGLVTAKAVGTVTISAASGAQIGFADVIVVAPSVPAPGTVSDLAVLSTTDSSATLAFSQVDNGFGQPAMFDIRFAVSPIGFGWSSATTTTRGTCSSPLAGNGVSGTRTCTVLGLLASTTYDFRMVAYRLSSSGKIFGGLSNVATAATTVSAVTPPGPPASVTVTPSSVSISVGASQGLAATVKDATGRVLSGQLVSWSTSVSSIAVVDAAGTVTVVAAGSATITATSGGKSGTASVTVSGVSPPPTPGWPNEPAGFTLYTDQKWNALNGWTFNNNEGGNTIITSRADSPFPDKGMLQYKQPIGMLGGGGGGTPGPGSADFAFGGTVLPTEVFVGAWVKVGSPYTPPPSTGQKLWYIQDAVGAGGWAGSMWLEFWGTPGAALVEERPHVVLINQMSATSDLYAPNVTSTELKVGVWHQYEMYFKQPTTATSFDGVVKVWIDGVLNISKADVPGLFYGGRGFDSVHQNMQWGGGGIMMQDQYIWATHNRISGR